MYSQVFLVGTRLSEHLRLHLKLWGCIPWGQHSEFLWNSLVVSRQPGLWPLGTMSPLTAELVAYHALTPVSKQPCERQRHGCCPAQWIWDTVYDECYKGGQPDLSLLLLTCEMLRQHHPFLGGRHWPDQTHQLCIRHAKHEPAGMKPSKPRCSTTRNCRIADSVRVGA